MNDCIVKSALLKDDVLLDIEKYVNAMLVGKAYLSSTKE